MEASASEIPFEPLIGHRHIFLGESSARNERRTWIVVALCAAMMLIEIAGGGLFGSISLVAEGIHMSTHAGAMLLAALAYRYARRHAEDARFALGTGKFGDLAAFASAIVLAMFSVLIGYEAISRFFSPEHIDLAAAIPIAGLGLVVNVLSAFLLSDDHEHGHHHHEDGHGHRHAPGAHDHADARHPLDTSFGSLTLAIFEEGVPPRFRLSGAAPGISAIIETVRPDGAEQKFAMAERDGFLESIDVIPEPHGFRVILRLHAGERAEQHEVRFEEHGHDTQVHRDNNMRAAYVHVLADAAVSVLVIIGLLMVKFLGWTWMDPVMGIVGAIVVANWSFGLIKAASGVLLDMTPEPGISKQIRTVLERGGDRVTDLHVWRLGPGHLGAIIALRSAHSSSPRHYKAQLSQVPNLSHVTIEVEAA